MKKTLAVILVIAVTLFAVAFGLDSIAQRNAQKDHVWLLETLLPGGTDFVSVPYDGEDTMIRSVHKAEAGFVIETATQGYADEIVMYIGVNKEGAVTGLVAFEAHETPSLGNNILTDHVFLSQFLNKTGPFSIGAAEADASTSATGESAAPEGEEIPVDGITGATVTSKAVARCVNAAVAYVTGADIDSSATQ